MGFDFSFSLLTWRSYRKLVLLRLMQSLLLLIRVVVIQFLLYPVALDLHGMQLVHKSELLLVHFDLAAWHWLFNVMKWVNFVLGQNFLLPLKVGKSSLFLLTARKHIIFLAANLRSTHSSFLQYLLRVWFGRWVVCFLVRFLRRSFFRRLQLLWHEISLRMGLV